MLVERKIDFVKEQIASENVYDIAKIVAIVATKCYIKHAGSPVVKMYNDLCQDIAKINNINRLLSSSYDFVQSAALFLCENIGKALGDTYKLNNRGRKITIFEMAERMVNREIGRTLRINYRKVDESKLETVAGAKDIFDNSTTEESYDKVEKTIDSLNLNETQRTALECRMLGYSYPQTAKIISRALSTTFEMMQKISKRYINLYK